MASRSYRIPWWYAVVLGTAAYVFGFLSTHYFVQLGPVPHTGMNVSNATLSGWLFYNANHVPISSSLSAAGTSRSATLAVGNLINEGALTPYIGFLYLLPVIFLTWAGFAATALTPNTSRFSYNLLNGASIAIGYCLTGLLGALLFLFSQFGLLFRTSISPSLPQTVLWFPVLAFISGGIGAVVYLLLDGSISIN